MCVLVSMRDIVSEPSTVDIVTEFDWFAFGGYCRYSSYSEKLPQNLTKLKLKGWIMILWMCKYT